MTTDTTEQQAVPVPQWVRDHIVRFLQAENAALGFKFDREADISRVASGESDRSLMVQAFAKIAASPNDPKLCECENDARRGIATMCFACTGPVGEEQQAVTVAQEYRKTATIRASQWWKMGDHPAVVMASDVMAAIVAGHPTPWCPTLEGGHDVTPGDWIATGVQGEHWPIKAEVFAATYEPVEPAMDFGEAIDPNASHNRRHRLASVSSASAEGAWKTAVIDGLICAHALKAEHESDPRKALHDLIMWEVSVALDPRVSAEAAALLAASPEPVPATNQAGEDVKAQDPAALLAHLQRMPMTEWIWHDASMIFATLSALATQPATSQEGEVTQSDKDCLVSVAASLACGAQSLAAQQIANYRARNVLAASPTPPTLSEDLRAAVAGIADDYMTSEAHHPGYVLIPTAKFEELSALARAQVKAS